MGGSAQSQNSISMAPSADGIDPVVVTGRYMDAPNDLSVQATGFNYAPVFGSQQFTQYNPARAGTTILVAGMTGGAALAAGAVSAPIIAAAVRGPALGAIMELTGSQINGYAAEEVTSVIQTEGYIEDLEGLEQLGQMLRSVEVPEVTGPEIPW